MSKSSKPERRKLTSRQAETEIAEQAFREALRGGDKATDAWRYAGLMVESAKLARG